MIGVRRRDRPSDAAVERVDRDLLQVTVPDGHVLRTGCDSHAGVLSVWLVPGQRFTDGTLVSGAGLAEIERQVASYAEASGLTLSVNRS